MLDLAFQNLGLGIAVLLVGRFFKLRGSFSAARNSRRIWKARGSQSRV